MKLHNGGTLGLGTSRNVSGILNSLLQQHCDGSFFNGLLFTFSALKKPATELKLSFMSGEKYVNKKFLLFSGSAEVSPNETFESCELSVEITPAEDFLMFNPPPTWISRVFDPSSCENFQNPISRGGVDFFWNPMGKSYMKNNYLLYLVTH